MIKKNHVYNPNFESTFIINDKEITIKNNKDLKMVGLGNYSMLGHLDVMPMTASQGIKRLNFFGLNNFVASLHDFFIIFVINIK